VWYDSKAAVMVSTGNAIPPKSTKSRNLDSLVSLSTDLKYNFGPISICTERSQFFDVVDFGGVVLSVGSVTYERHERNGRAVVYTSGER